MKAPGWGGKARKGLAALLGIWEPPCPEPRQARVERTEPGGCRCWAR